MDKNTQSVSKITANSAVASDLSSQSLLISITGATTIDGHLLKNIPVGTRIATAAEVNNALTGLAYAMHFRGSVSVLPAASNYQIGDIVLYNQKAHVCVLESGSFRWIELGSPYVSKEEGKSLIPDDKLQLIDTNADKLAKVETSTNKNSQQLKAMVDAINSIDFAVDQTLNDEKVAETVLAIINAIKTSSDASQN